MLAFYNDCCTSLGWHREAAELQGNIDKKLAELEETIKGDIPEMLSSMVDWDCRRRHVFSLP